MTKAKEKLIVIDGNALIHRSFHALPQTMTTRSGEMVNAVYGFTVVLLKALREFRPDYIALTLDKKGPTFRHKKYKEYKATRVKAPDELYQQFGKIKEIARALAVPIFEKTGFEADDLIGTIVNKVNDNIEKIIITGDLDTIQLVNGHTKVFTMSRGLSGSVIYDEKAVKNRYGLVPGQMIDFKALCGDPSDNIPGVRGVGEKTAVELLKEFKTLENLYKNLNSKKIKERVSELLKKYKKDAMMSKGLATIKCDVDIKFNLTKARFGGFNQADLMALFSELEFKSLLPRIKELLGREKKSIDGILGVEDKFERNRKKFRYILIGNPKKTDRENNKLFASFITELKKQNSFTIDTETSGFNTLTAELLGISFSWKQGQAYFVKLPKSDNKELKKISLFDYQNDNKSIGSEWLNKLKPILENKKIKKFGHNIKFDVKVLASQGIGIGGVAFDTMIASYLLNPGTRQHNLDTLTFMELGFEKISKEDLLGKGRDKINFSQVAAEKLSLYSCEDADFTNRLASKLKKQLRDQGLDKLFKQIELPLIEVLAEMEKNGVKLDTKYLAQIQKQTAIKIKQLERKIHKQAGVKFNIKSTQQLREVLFEKLEIPQEGVSKTKTGISTAAEELKKLKDFHPIIRLIQEYRELTKLANTYIDALPKLINKKSKRLHTSFNQTITATGRLSSSGPNLQNIPIRTELGKQIRGAFVSDRGYELTSLDYSQIELRLAAHMSGDKKMIKAFKQGEDIHRATAAEINEVNPEEVTPEMRREAKAINFGILYGQGPFGLSQTANIPIYRAKEFIDKYFSAYIGIKKFIDKIIKQSHKDGYIETMLGRRRYLPEINSSVVQIRKAAERMAINTPLQGTAADIIKIAMIDSDKFIKKNYHNNEVRLLLQVHDELLLEIKAGKVKEVANKIKKIMESVIKLEVKIEVDVKAGKNWKEMKKI